MHFDAAALCNDGAEHLRERLYEEALNGCLGGLGDTHRQ